MLWKKHPIYESYFMSQGGNIFGLKSGKILKTSKSNSGYFCVPIRHNGKYKNIFIHRELSRVFIGCVDGMDINHKDGNKTNNSIDNLEIVTRKQNIDHALTTGLRKTKYSKELVNNIREDYRSGHRQCEICKKYGVSKHLVFDVVRGRSRNVV